MTAPVTPTGPFIVTQRQRDRSARAGLQAGDCICVCAACGARMVVPPAAGHPPILQHREGCERSWGFTPDEAILYEDGTQATVDDWPNGVAHTRVVYREAFATLEGRRGGREALHDRLNVYLDTLDDLTYRSMDERVDALRAEINSLDKSGGTLSLPNGDVIEVKRASYEWLSNRLAERGKGSTFAREYGGDICAAWNAEYGIGLEAGGR